MLYHTEMSYKIQTSYSKLFKISFVQSGIVLNSEQNNVVVIKRIADVADRCLVDFCAILLLKYNLKRIKAIIEVVNK